jgi:hypothetical protein
MKSSSHTLTPPLSQRERENLWRRIPLRGEPRSQQ